MHTRRATLGLSTLTLFGCTVAFFITYILLHLTPPTPDTGNWTTLTPKPAHVEKEDDLRQVIKPEGRLCSQHWASSTLSSPRLKQIRIFVAIMLHNNCPIMPNLSSQLMRLFTAMNPQFVHISILESGSSDCTPHVLALLRQSLDALGVKSTINQDASLSIGNFTSECVDNYPARYWHWSPRIPFLAHLRNMALAPLFNHSINGITYDRVLFLNDVLFCAEDLAMLLLQPPAHILSGIDVQRETKPRPSDGGTQLKLGVYDRWVFRDMNGSMFIDDPRGEHLSEMKHTAKMYPPFSNLTHTLRHVDRAEPFPVQCTWGGAALIDPRIFLEHGVRFRPAAWPGECSASECSLFCNDVWRIYGAKSRVVVDPRVAVAYTPFTWDLLWAIRLHKIPITKVHAQWYSLLSPPDPQPVLEKILDPRNPTLPIIPDSSEISVPRVVVCMPTVDSTHAELRYPYPDAAWMSQVPEVPAGICPNDRMDEYDRHNGSRVGNGMTLQQQGTSHFREWFRSITTCSSDHSPTIALHTTNILTSRVQLLIPAKIPIVLHRGAIWIAANIRPGQEVLFADQMRRLLQHEELLSHRKHLFVSAVIVGASRWDTTHAKVLSALHATAARNIGLTIVHSQHSGDVSSHLESRIELIRAHGAAAVTAGKRYRHQGVMTNRRTLAFVLLEAPFCASNVIQLLLETKVLPDATWNERSGAAAAIAFRFTLSDGPDVLVAKLPKQ